VPSVTLEPPQVASTRLDQEVVELPLLLPRWQALELEAVARQQGMTTGQMLRRVIRDLLSEDNSGTDRPSALRFPEGASCT
jgi:hypothetical protein